MEANPTDKDPIHDASGESPVEITEFNAAGLIIRSLESGRVWGIAVNKENGEEVITPTELEA